MADLIGTPVATQIKPFTGMSLADIASMAGNLQGVAQAAKLNPLQLEQARQQVEQSKLATESAKMGISEKKLKKIADSQIAMINNPMIVRAEKDPQSVDPRMLADLVTRNGMETAKAMGIPDDQAMQLLQPYLERAMQDPAGLRGYFKERHINSLDEASRTALFEPRTQEIQTGAGGKTISVGEFGPYGVGTTVPGTEFATQLPPGSRVQPTGRVDPQGNPTAYIYDANGRLIGEQVIPAGVGGAGIGPGAGQPFAAAGLPPDLAAPIPFGAGAAMPGAGAGMMPPPPPPPFPGAGAGAPVRLTAPQAGMMQEEIKTAQEDWIATQERNKLAQQNIATFQKIKSLIPESFTGVGGSAKQFASALAQSIGVPLNVLETASTEELMKNTKLLQLAGGNTDAARSIAEMANPSAKMTKEGLLRVTNQLISFEKLNQARARFLQPYAQDAATYVKAKQQFDTLADPRMFQEMSADDVGKMKAGMSEAEQAELLAKIKAARDLGILPPKPQGNR